MPYKGTAPALTDVVTGQIIDLSEEKIYDLDMRRKTYKVTTFEELRRQMRGARATAGTIERVMVRGKALGRQQQCANEIALFGREIVQRSPVRLRDHESVERRLRMNVLEGENPVVVVEAIGGKLAARSPRT